jgi:uncharacterized protein (DUF927 family)
MYNITDKDYTLVEQETGELSDFYGIRLKTGKWKNVVFVFGKVSIKEDTVEDTATISFTYNIQDPNEYDVEALEKDEEFNDYLGSILQYIVTQSLEKEEAQIGHKTSTTDTHTEQPTQ